MPDYLKFETERLWLRPTTLEDAAFIYELMNTPQWKAFIGDRKIHTVEAAEAYIKVRMFPQLKRLGYGNYAVIRKSDGVKLGTCGLYDREGLEGVDIGFAFLPEYFGQGYAFEAAQEILRAAQQEFGIKQIKGITAKDNVASQKLLKKLGLKNQGTIQLPDDDEELLLFQL